MSVYPKIDVPHPLPWYLLTHGEVQMGSSTAPLRALVARRDQLALQQLPDWSRIESALDRLNATFPTVSPTPDDFCAFWVAMIAALVTPAALNGDALTDLWLGAAKDGVVPSELPSSTGRILLSAVSRPRPLIWRDEHVPRDAWWSCSTLRRCNSGSKPARTTSRG